MTDWHPLQSTNLEACSWERRTDGDFGTLAVRFRSGAEWHYGGVPRELFEELCEAESPGRFFAQSIKGSFEGYRAVEEKAETD